MRDEADLRPDEPPPELTAEVTIEHRSDGIWRLTLVLRSADASDERIFDADTCAAVVEAAAVVVSFRVVELNEATIPEPGPAPDPDESSPEIPTVIERPESPARAQQGASFATPSLEPIVVAPRSEQPAPRRVEPIGGWIAASAGVALGAMPSVGASVGLEGGIERRHWRAGLGVRGLPLRVGDHPQDGDVQGRFDLVAAQVLGCGVPWAGPVGFALCGRFEAGGIRAAGQGAVAERVPSWSDWVGAGGSVGAAWRVTRWLAPFVAGELLGMIRRPRFLVGSVAGTLHETGPIAFRASLGLEFHL